MLEASISSLFGETLAEINLNPEALTYTSIKSRGFS